VLGSFLLAFLLIYDKIGQPLLLIVADPVCLLVRTGFQPVFPVRDRVGPVSHHNRFRTGSIKRVKEELTNIQDLYATPSLLN
jgi:hypothetical protein